MLKFLVGIFCGTLVGLLVAPAPGEETREQLMDAARQPAETARRKVRDIRETVAQKGAELGRQAAEKAMDRVIPDNLQARG